MNHTVSHKLPFTDEGHQQGNASLGPVEFIDTNTPLTGFQRIGFTVYYDAAQPMRGRYLEAFGARMGDMWHDAKTKVVTQTVDSLFSAPKNASFPNEANIEFLHGIVLAALPKSVSPVVSPLKSVHGNICVVNAYEPDWCNKTMNMTAKSADVVPFTIDDTQVYKLNFLQ